MASLKKYVKPAFLPTQVNQEKYERWLRRKAQAVVRRDRRRGFAAAIGECYRVAIHKAVLESQGRDAYTGEMLDWTLISQFNNTDAKDQGREIKKKYALLPTVDHIDGVGSGFKICSWRTNDAKNDLALPEFIALCKAVLKHHEPKVSIPARELWLYKNKRALKAAQMGMRDMKAGKASRAQEGNFVMR